MVDDDAYSVGAKKAGDAQLVAGTEVGIVGDVEEMGLIRDEGEHGRIVEHSHVDAAGVGRIVVHIGQAAAAERLGLHKVAHHRLVFDLGYAYDGRSGRGRFGDEIGYGVGEIVDFQAVFSRIPLA